MNKSPENNNNPESPAPRIPRLSPKLWWALGGLGAISVITIGGMMYARAKLGPLIQSTVQTELTKTLKRPVNVGEVENIWFNSLRFGPSKIPPTTKDPDQAKVEAIEAKFSIWDIIINRTLKLDINVIAPQAYLEEDAQGKWVEMPQITPAAAGLFKTEIHNINLEKAQLSVAPYKSIVQKLPPTEINVDRGNFRLEKEGKQIFGSVKGDFVGANFDAKSEIDLGQNNLKLNLDLDKISLPEVARLVPVPGLSFQSGNAAIKGLNLDLDFGTKKINNLVGDLRINRGAGTIPNIPESISNLNGGVRFDNSELNFDKLTVNYGKLPLAIDGKISKFNLADLGQAELQLTGSLAPVNFNDVLDIAKRQGIILPIATTGKIGVNLQVKGPVKSTITSGKINIDQAQIDRIDFNKINTGFNVNLRLNDKLAPTAVNVGLQDIDVSLKSGGKLGGKGTLEIGQLDQAAKPVKLAKKEPGSKLDFNLVFKDISADELALVYAPKFFSPNNRLKIGKFSGEAFVKGSLEDPQVNVLFKNTDSSFPAQGEISFNNNNIEVKNTTIEIAKGKLDLVANKNQENWQANANIDGVNLQQLQSDLPMLNLPAELTGTLTGNINADGASQNISPTNANVNIEGKVANIAGGNVNLVGNLSQGKWLGSIATDYLALELLRQTGLSYMKNLPPTEYNPNLRMAQAVLQDLPPIRGFLNGEVNAVGSIDNNSFNIANITTDSNVKVISDNGNLNSNIKLDGNEWQTVIGMEQIGIGPLRELTTKILNNPELYKQESLANLRQQLNNFTAIDGTINGNANVAGNLENSNPNALIANGNFQVATDNLGTINATGKLAAGQFDVDVKTAQLSLPKVNNFARNIVEKQENQQNLIDNLKKYRNLDGTINANAQISGNINDKPELINATGEVGLITSAGNLNARGKLNNESWQASINSSSIDTQKLQNYLKNAGIFTDDLPQGINGTIQANADLIGNLNNNQPQLVSGEGKLNINTSVGEVLATGKVSDNLWEANATTNKIDLASLRSFGLTILENNPQLVANQSDVENKLKNLKSLQGNLTANANMRGNLTNFNPNNIRGNGSAEIQTLGGVLNSQVELTGNDWEMALNLDNFSIQELQPILLETNILTTKLPSEIDGVVNGKINLAGKTDNINLAAIQGQGATNLDLVKNGGRINVTGNLINGNWATKITGSDILMARFNDLLQGQQLAQNLQKTPGQSFWDGMLNTQIQLTGDLANSTLAAIRGKGDLQLSQLPVLAQEFNTKFAWNGQQIVIDEANTPGLIASGIIDVALPTNSIPSISNVDFQVKTDSFKLENLKLPATLTGALDFAGKISGEPTKLLADGKINLANFAVNGIVFDPILAGNLNFGMGKGGGLKLTGNKDIIQVALDSSYLPTEFLIKRDEAIAKGAYQGEVFKVDLASFPLALLNITPTPEVGTVTGVASGQFDILGMRPFDLAKLAVDGQIAITKPSIGYIDFDSFAALVNYKNNKFNLTKGELRHGNSQYLIATTVDLPALGAANPNNKLPRFDGKIEVIQGNIQDILVSLKYFNIDDFARGLQAPTYGKAADLNTTPVGVKDTTLMTQVRRFAEISELVEKTIKEKEASPVPELSKLQANFNGIITASGSLAEGINANFKLQGQDWNWGQYVANKFLLEGEFANNILTILPLEIESGDAIIGFTGKINPERQSGQFRIANVDLEKLQAFLQSFPPTQGVNLPSLTGNMNLTATIAGNLDNPLALGELSLAEGTINTKPIKSAKGSFSYNNARLFFRGDMLATETEPVQITGTLPYPLPFAKVKPDNDNIDIRASVKDGGLAVINLINPEISWIDGKGNVELKVTGTLQEPFPEGTATFEKATIAAQAFPEQLTDLNGIVKFERDRIRVENLGGNLSKGKVLIAGVIPVVKPLADVDPDYQTPLTLNLDKLALNLKGLYRGGTLGNIVVSNTALNPRLSGEIQLYDGKIYLSGAGSSQTPTKNTADPVESEFGLGFNDLKISLDKKMRIVSPPLVDFTAQGVLTLNGLIDSLKPSGTIELKSGGINLYSTRMRLARAYPQTATFIPSQGLDPTLNVRLVASVPETTGYRVSDSAFPGEIEEGLNINTIGTSRNVSVIAEVKGRASELANSLELSSSPRRSQSEIVGLLGGSFVQSLGGGDGTLALANLAGSSLFSSFQQQITDATGLSEFRIFPARIGNNNSRSSRLGVGMELGADIGRNFSFSVVRILANNQPTDFSLRYRINEDFLLRGITNFREDSRLSVEYQIKF